MAKVGSPGVNVGAMLHAIKVPGVAPAQRRPNPTMPGPTSSSNEPQSTVKLPKPVRPKNNPAVSNPVVKTSRGGNNGVTPVSSPLTPLTNKQITDEAKNIANATYAGQYKTLNSEQNQAVGLDQKRAADQQQYDSWLATQGAALQANNANIMGTLENQNAAIQTAANLNLAAQPTASGELAGEDQAALGGANGALVNADTSSDKTLIGDAAQASNTGAALGAGQLGGTIENGFSQQDQIRQTQLADLQTTLEKISADKDTLGSDKAAALAKEVSALQSNNTNVAEYNQNYATAAEKLGITAADTKSEIASRAAATKISAATLAARIKQDSTTNAISQQRVNNEWTVSEQEAANRSAAYKLDVKKFGLEQTKQAWEEAHPSASQQKAASGEPNALPQSETNESFARIDSARAQIEKMIASHVNPQQALINMQQGLHTPTTTSNGTKSEGVDIQPWSYGASELQAAYELATNGYVTPGTLAQLNKQGVYGVRAKYRVYDSPGQDLNDRGSEKH